MIWFLFALLFVAALVLAPGPKLENARAGKFGDFQFPRIDEGTPKQLLYGTRRIKGPVIMAAGDFRSVEIRKKVKTGLFKKKKVTIGHEYFLGFQLGFCLHSNSSIELTKLYADEKVVYSGSVIPAGDDGTLFTVNRPNIYGGYSNGGGIRGNFRFYDGRFTQNQNVYLRRFGTLTPNYRGLCHLVAQQPNIGESTQLKPFSAELRNIPAGLGVGRTAVGLECNPANMIYDLMTNDWGRMGLNTALVNTVGFQAAADTLVAEGNGISMTLEQSLDADEAVQEVLRQIDGILAEDVQNQTMNLILIRDDYVAADLPLFDESNVKDVRSFQTKLWANNFNEVRVKYPSRDDNYKEKMVTAQDQAAIGQDGRIISTTYSFPGVCTAALANQIAARELQFNSTPFVSAALICNREASSLSEGSVFRWSNEEYQIVEAVMRVTNIDLGELDNGRVIVECVQDKFSTTESIYSDTGDFEDTGVDGTAVATTVCGFLDLPIWFSNQLFLAAEVSSPERNHVMYLAEAPTPESVAFIGLVSSDSGVTYDAQEGTSIYMYSGLVETAITIDEGFPTTLAIQLKNLNFDPVTLGFQTTFGAADNEGGEGLLLINGEWIGTGVLVADGDGTYTLTGCRRAMLSSMNEAHAVDDVVYFVGYADLDALVETDLGFSERIDVRLLTTTGLDILDEADASSFNHTTPNVTGLDSINIPYPVRLFAIGGITFPAEITSLSVISAWRLTDWLSEVAVYSNSVDQSTSMTYDHDVIFRYNVNGGAFGVEQNLGTNTIASNLDFTGVPAVADTDVIEMEIWTRSNLSGATARNSLKTVRSFIYNAP